MFGIGNPQALLRPWRDLRQFTEELYAMMVSHSPVEREGPVTIRVREGQTGLKLTRGTGDPPAFQAVQPRPRPAPSGTTARPSLPIGGPVREAPRAPAVSPEEPSSARTTATPAPAQPAPTGSSGQSASRRPRPVQGQPGERGRDARRPRSERRPLLEVEGEARFSGPEPARFEVPPQVFDKRRHQWYTPPAFVLPDDPPFPFPGGGGTTTFVGKVVSGSGDTYQVTLYPNGPAGDPGDTVEATVPTIDPGETIDPGFWAYNVFLFVDADGNPIYSFQPPVWLS